MNFHLIPVLIFLSFSLLCFGVEDDVSCLEGVKKSLVDSQGQLSSWDLSNTSASHICNLNGVNCWSLKESRILSLTLSQMGLSGQLPESLKNCHSLQTLDLSRNSISGSIPAQICNWFPYLVSLDLSSNQLSGSIPVELADCKFLNKLVLSNNKLSGSIPYELSRLQRLKEFSVSDNGLSGSVPSDVSRFGESSFDGNDGLCGEPLESCGLRMKSYVIVAAGVAGAVGGLLLGLGVWCYRKRREDK